jgi:hypothetical protein
MRKILLVSATAAALSLGLTAPAMAAPGDTAATFTVTGGSLGITVPASAILSSGAAGTAVGGALGTVTVTDGRNNANAAWTTSASSTAFNIGAGGTNTTVDNTAVTYTPGAMAQLTGGTDSTAVAGAGGTMGTAVDAASSTGFGLNSASWNPTLSIAVPSSSLSGGYAGTITHSVV